MKKLSEFSLKEVRDLIISLCVELKKIMSDDELKEVLRAVADIKQGNKTDITNLDAVFAIINSLLVTNEQAFYAILAAFSQSTVDEVREMNNVEVVTTVVDFLSIDIYKRLLSQGIKSAMTVA